MTTAPPVQPERYSYVPDEVLPPGETIRETLEALEMSQAQLAARTGLSTKHVNQIIQGNAVLSHETAIALERVTGVPARFWNSLETNYRDYVSRHDERKSLASQLEWLKKMPIAVLRKLGKITAPASDKPRVLQEALHFFGVASVDAWEEVWANPTARYLKSAAFTVEPGAMAAWLRLGELKATRVPTEPFNRSRLRSSLAELRGLTVLKPAEFEPRMKLICARSGVAVVFMAEVTGCRASGATRWLSPTKVVVQLSLRGKRNDKLWFAFFHEIAHVLLHGKRSVFIDVENKGGTGTSDEEEEANNFAADVLVPREHKAAMRRLDIWNPRQVRSFADRIGVAPGIVAGQLQHHHGNYKILNELFEKYELA